MRRIFANTLFANWWRRIVWKAEQEVSNQGSIVVGLYLQITSSVHKEAEKIYMEFIIIDQWLENFVHFRRSLKLQLLILS